MVGDTNVGKTLLLNRYVKGSLPKQTMPTVGVEYKLKEVTLKNNEVIKANIWDTGTLSLSSSYLLY
jgi:Ras-related protein Rab-11B